MVSLGKHRQFKKKYLCLKLLSYNFNKPTILQGFVPAFVRLGPQTILTWIFKEQLRLRLGRDPI